MKKAVFLIGVAVMVVVVLVVVFRTDVGGVLCGTCPPTGLMTYKRSCIGIMTRDTYADGYTDYCYGMPVGERRCFGRPHGSDAGSRVQELPCDYEPYRQAGP